MQTQGKRWKERSRLKEKEEGRRSYILDDGGDVQTSDARRGKLARVNVGNFPHSSIDVFQVLSLHYQDRLGRVKVELREEKTELVDRQTHSSWQNEPFIAALNEMLQICLESGLDTLRAYKSWRSERRIKCLPDRRGEPEARALPGPINALFLRSVYQPEICSVIIWFLLIDFNTASKAEPTLNLY